MIYPLIGPRLHGWLDDLVSLVYLAGAWALHLHGAPLTVALLGALIHFTLTRVTNYPQGTWKRLSFRTHAYVELGEGVLVGAATVALRAPAPALYFLAFMTASQAMAFAFSDYDWPKKVTR